MIATVGRTFINSQQFTTDPSIARDWPPRRSRLAGIGGSVTQQDFGRFAKDMRLTLSSAAPSGSRNLINHAFKITLDGLLNTRLQTYAYRDYTGLEGTVVVVDFTPVATFIRDGVGVLWEYTLVLDVVTLTKLDFANYTGA